ncbi:MAG: thioredoxin [Segatella copri]
MKKNVCLYAMMALAFMGCSQNNKKQEGISKGLPSRVESESKAEKVGQSVAGSSNQSASVGKVQVLTASDFRKKIMDYEAHPDEWVFAGSRPAVIDFYTTWCGPCKMMAPVVESLAEKYAGKIDFYKVDIDQESELASVFGISSIPTFLFIPVKGKPSVQMGAMQKEDFEELIGKIKTK